MESDVDALMDSEIESLDELDVVSLETELFVAFDEGSIIFESLVDTEVMSLVAGLVLPVMESLDEFNALSLVEVWGVSMIMEAESDVESAPIVLIVVEVVVRTAESAVAKVLVCISDVIGGGIIVAIHRSSYVFNLDWINNVLLLCSSLSLFADDSQIL